jgi:hypothetical protein
VRKVPAKKVVPKMPKKAAVKKPPLKKKASMAALMTAPAAPTPPPADGNDTRRYTFPLFQLSGGAEHAAADTLPRSRAANESFVDMLNSATIDIDTAPLGDDEYDEAAMDYEMRPESDEEEAAEGCEEEAAEEITQEEAADVLINPAPAPAKKVSIRMANYSEVEDTALIRVWESVSIDAVIGTDQTGKRYWHMIEDAFFQNMSPNALTSSHTYRSLKGRWDVIKSTVSRWSGCLEQVRNAPPSGTNVDDWEAIAIDRYK